MCTQAGGGGGGEAEGSIAPVITFLAIAIIYLIIQIITIMVRQQTTNVKYIFWTIGVVLLISAVGGVMFYFKSKGPGTYTIINWVLFVLMLLSFICMLYSLYAKL